MLDWSTVERAVSETVSRFPELQRVSIVDLCLDPGYSAKIAELVRSRNHTFRIFTSAGAVQDSIFRIPGNPLSRNAYVRIPYDMCLVFAGTRDEAQIYCQKVRPMGLLVTESDFAHVDFKQDGRVFSRLRRSEIISTPPMI